jgi:hypothetical protein
MWHLHPSVGHHSREKKKRRREESDPNISVGSERNSTSNHPPPFLSFLSMSRGVDREPCPYRIVDDAGNAFLFGLYYYPIFS